MDTNFSLKFVLICLIAALSNAVVIVSIYLVANNKLGESDVVVKSYLVGATIGILFYISFFYLPNYRAHLRLSKYEGDKYIRSLKSQLDNRKLHRLILSHWFLNEWRAKRVE